MNSYQRLLIRCLAILSFATSSFIGCSGDNPVESNNSIPAIIPLAIGNSWSFSTTMYDTLGSIQAQLEITQTVTGDTTLFGKRLFKYYSLWAANTDSGIISYSGYSISSFSPTDTVASYVLLYKYPARPGDNFRTGMSVVSIDTLITVPAGSFNCIKYQSSIYSPLDGYIYIAPGIGIIKTINYYYNLKSDPSRLAEIMELKTYVLK